MYQHTLGRSPARQLTSELDTEDLGGLQLPRQVGHDVDSVSTTNTNSGHTKTTTVGGVRVSTNEETTGESIVFKENLVDDTRARAPETNVVLGTSRRQEVVDLLVDTNGALKILGAADLGLNQMVAVDSGRVRDGVHASGHELKNSHLGSGILASHTVRAQLEVRLASLELLVVRVVQVRVQDLLGKGQGSVEPAADNREVLRHLLVVDEVVLLPVVLADLHVGKASARSPGQTVYRIDETRRTAYLSVESRIRDGSQTANAAGRATDGAAPSNTAQNLSGSKHGGQLSEGLQTAVNWRNQSTSERRKRPWRGGVVIKRREWRVGFAWVGERCFSAASGASRCPQRGKRWSPTAGIAGYDRMCGLELAWP